MPFELQAAPSAEGPDRPRSHGTMPALGRHVAALWRGEAGPVTGLPDLAGRGRAFVVARAGGRRVAAAWSPDLPTADGLQPLADALARAVAEARDGVPADRLSAVDTLEVVLAYGLSDPLPDDKPPPNLVRGLLGLEIANRGAVVRHAPTEFIASNRDFRRVRELFAEAHGSEGISTRTFGAAQALVPLAAPDKAPRLFRGNRVVGIEEIDRGYVAALAAQQAGWLARNLHDDGRMTYKYWPSAGSESDANNMIRQWMATVALGRVARRDRDQALAARLDLNIRYNLDRFFEERGPLGCIVEAAEGGDKVKLGAVALATLALIEHPQRHRFSAYEEALLRTVDHLRNPDGSFRTFLVPAERNDCQNFYPGEALLMWSQLHLQDRREDVLDRIVGSFRYYRDWHLANRNPAFVPWHTQAYVQAWSARPSDEMRDFVFLMNDWLLGMQQWESLNDVPDAQGRFYKAGGSFGPPHASSTGVYLEGLIDAWRLARETGDERRRERYRRAIVRGLRSLAQLTFKDDADMFYVSRRDRVLGGVRTTEYNNEIRVDNVQHGLMAMLRILDNFPAEDFRP